MLMPAFTRHLEANLIVGKLLTGYTDLELDLCHAVAMANNDFEGVVRTIFKDRGESRRIETAKKLGRDSYKGVGLETEFRFGIIAMRYCLKIRNQYAHSQWVDRPDFGLGFVNIESLAKQPTRIDYANLTFQWIDVPLLKEQQSYFEHTQKGIAYLNYEARFRAGTIASPLFPAPQPQPKPRLHK